VLRSVRNDFQKLESQTEELYRMAEDMNIDGIIGKLKEIVPEYTPWNRRKHHQRIDHTKVESIKTTFSGLT